MVYSLILVVFEICFLYKVQRFVHNCLWGASDVNERSKVAWKVIISPPHEGGLGLIDPMFQCRALLGKFIVRSMMQGMNHGNCYFMNV